MEGRCRGEEKAVTEASNPVTVTLSASRQLFYGNDYQTVHITTQCTYVLAQAGLYLACNTVIN